MYHGKISLRWKHVCILASCILDGHSYIEKYQFQSWWCKSMVSSYSWNNSTILCTNSHFTVLFVTCTELPCSCCGWFSWSWESNSAGVIIIITLTLYLSTCSPPYYKCCWVSCSLPLGEWTSMVDCPTRLKSPGCSQLLFVTTSCLGMSMIQSGITQSSMPVL